jgi:hypothetical protein
VASHCSSKKQASPHREIGGLICQKNCQILAIRRQNDALEANQCVIKTTLMHEDRELYTAVCEQDLEASSLSKRTHRTTPAALPLSWLKVKNLRYSQARDRHELFERRSAAK